ncbi:hypothetical protein HETIRDRAFT_102241 [Heterobasidion irregulare TC 32-1]|uniref:Uncharacterized protein n=1 Tax=Heterobasidion irregulare (strain TC 32-1) TaxID=747525 RepID=W4KDX9_HETIT|nr:uncharacterized protein HETIRDRAFT_102241 [Heterobasidion irregulare TC 32-1]ETW83520.1 hypothetical protein HETIRDRAFT_102241 [Heterobasidion irregulare TC 32-1]
MSSFHGTYIPCLRPYPFTDRPHSTTSPSHDAGPPPRDYPISILRISESNYVGTDGIGYLVSRVPPYTALLLPSSPLSVTCISDSRTDDTLAGRPSSPIFLSTSAPSAARSLRPHAHYTSLTRLVLHRTLGLARLPPAPSPDSRRLPLTTRASTESRPHTPADDTRSLSLTRLASSDDTRVATRAHTSHRRAGRASFLPPRFRVCQPTGALCPPNARPLPLTIRTHFL